jgi:uncharacterized RDD family membrane protein YckC
MTAIEGSALMSPNVISKSASQGGKEFRAPFSLRCGALLIDYIALISRMLGGGARSAGSSAETVGIFVAIVVTILNLGVLAGLTGMTLGKWATGLRIEKGDGSDLSIGRAFLRHFVGYPLSFLILGIGFLMAALTVRGRGLHDMIAGTVVVRGGSFSSRH